MSVFIPPYGTPPIPDAADDDGGAYDATVGFDAAYGSPPIYYDATESDAAADDRATSLDDAADGGLPVDEAGDSGHD